jgi:hypothetical protein
MLWKCALGLSDQQTFLSFQMFSNDARQAYTKSSVSIVPKRAIFVYNNFFSGPRIRLSNKLPPGLQFTSEMTDIVLDLQMLTIPKPIRGKLVGAGYNSFDKLPNDKSMDRWRDVKTECGLTGPELTQLMNIIFPVQQGNVIIA